MYTLSSGYETGLCTPGYPGLAVFCGLSLKERSTAPRRNHGTHVSPADYQLKSSQSWYRLQQSADKRRQVPGAAGYPSGNSAHARGSRSSDHSPAIHSSGSAFGCDPSVHNQEKSLRVRYLHACCFCFLFCESISERKCPPGGSSDHSPQLMRLALSDTKRRRKCHESAMSIVMKR